MNLYDGYTITYKKKGNEILLIKEKMEKGYNNQCFKCIIV